MLTNNFITFLAISIVCLFNIACNNNPPKKITRAFYYWKTNVDLSIFERKKLDSFGCSKLYLRFFDIDWNPQASAPIPLAVNHFKQSLPKNFSVVPVVFITQAALNNSPVAKLPDLAQHLIKLLYEKCVQAKLAPAEIQIDCDWSVSNQAKYFRLLKLCRRQPFAKNKILSCTIRLHQVKFLKASGIPPVDRGLLMCYNMGNLKLAGGNNSILDVGVAKQYLQNLQDYPVKLDVALPLFSWCLLFDNQNRFTGILRDVQQSDLLNNSTFNANGKNIYMITKDTTLKGYTLRPGETIRYENCDTTELYKLADFVSAKMNNTEYSLIFYHCDSAVLSKYNNYELEKIYHYFH